MRVATAEKIIGMNRIDKYILFLCSGLDYKLAAWTLVKEVKASSRPDRNQRKRVPVAEASLDTAEVSTLFRRHQEFEIQSGPTDR